MIQLRDDCLLVSREGYGGLEPISVGAMTLEIAGAGAGIDSDTLEHVAASVLHYFKVELGRIQVSVGEFAEALAKTLKGLGFDAEVTAQPGPLATSVSDLRQLAVDAGKLGELAFFERLRKAFDDRAAVEPTVLEFTGLRGCVKQLAGRKHWCASCDDLALLIVDTLRKWFGSDARLAGARLIVRS